MVGENKLRKATVIILFLFPSLVGVIVFYVMPMVQSAYLSFTDWDMYNKANFIGLENYINVFAKETSVNSILNTFKFIIGYIPLVICLGILVAVLLNKQMKGIKVYRAMFFIPVITSWVAVSIMWRWLLNGRSGMINYLLSLVGIQGPTWLTDFFWAMPAIIIASVWKDLGFVGIILLSGLQDIDEGYYEAAEIDGVTSIQKFFRITLPLLTPTIYFILIISLINSFQLFDQVMVMTGGGPASTTSTIVLRVFMNAFRGFRMGFASAQSWVLFIIILVFTLIQNRLQKRWVNYETK